MVFTSFSLCAVQRSGRLRLCSVIHAQRYEKESGLPNFPVSFLCFFVSFLPLVWGSFPTVSAPCFPCFLQCCCPVLFGCFSRSFLFFSCCFPAACPAAFLLLSCCLPCSFSLLVLLFSRCLSCSFPAACPAAFLLLALLFLTACLALSHCLSCSFPAACPALALMFDPCFSASFLSFSVYRSSFFVPYFPVSCRFFLFFHGFSSFSHGFLLFFRRQFLLFPSTFPPCYSLFLLFFPSLFSLPLLPFSRPRSPSTGFALFSGAFSSGLPVRRCLLSGAYDSCCCALPFLMGNV